MAPTLIASSAFDKDINKFAHEGQTCLVGFGYMHTRLALYKLSLLDLIEPQDDITKYVTIDRVGAKDNDDDITRRILDMMDQDASDKEIVETLLSSGLVDELSNVRVGRIALRDYSFRDHNGADVDTLQVAGVKVERTFQQQGISSRAYLFLLNWFEHLVCDDTQTIQGAKIWAAGLYDLCTVRIYNSKAQVFEDQLREFGEGAKGFLPWNKGMLMDLSGWTPNKIQTQIKKFIVLIISRDSSPAVGYCPPQE